MRILLKKKVITYLVILMTLGFNNAVARNLPDVTIKRHNGRPTVFIDDKPNALPGYCPWYTKTFYNTFMDPLYRQNMGVYFIMDRTLPGGLGESQFWRGDKIDNNLLTQEEKDFFSLDRQAEHILAGDPDAYLIIRLRHRAPNSWRDLHPAEFFIDEDGRVHDTPSKASDLFWEKASDFCTALTGFVESRPWADRVIGYMNIHLAEGVHIPVAEGFFYDHNPLMVQVWRNFLNNKYGTVEKLRTAYGDSTVTFDSKKIPAEKLRGSLPDVANMLYWQNARDNRELRDYLELQKELFHKRFRQISAGMKKGVRRNVLFMHDSMKQPMLGWNLFGFFAIGARKNISWNPAYPELMGGSGSIGVASLFNTVPGFNVLVTPHDYQVRGLGGVYEPEGMSDSAVLRGTYFWSEMDTRYCVNCRPDGSQTLGAAHTVDQWAAITWRNFAAGWTRGYNSYWHHSWTVADDWFLSEELHKVIERQIDVINESTEWVHEDVPGIAMIIDDSAIYETNGTGNFFNEAIMWEYKQGMARCGVPFRIYLFEDNDLDAMPEHRVWYFPNLFHADEKKLDVLKRKVFRNGNVVIWGPGSGISDGDTIGTESASKLTGFEFTMIPANAQRRILISNFNHPVTKDCDEAMVIGGSLAYGPVLIPTDGIELGRAWTKGGMNQIGMSLKEFGRGAAGNGNSGYSDGDYASVFITAVQIPPDLWRGLARYAGAHIWCEANEILLADKSVVAMHSLKSGGKTILLPGERRVRDLVSGKTLSRGTRKITFDIKAPETRVFLLEE